jgi:hypothetical protein
MKVVKKGRYILNAKWHAQNGKEVEIIMKRKGISPAYNGRFVYHVAFDPDEDFRSEDFDEEFIESNFKPLEDMTCVIDTTMASKDIIEKFEPYYKILKRKLMERINVQFIEHNIGDPELDINNYLCVFYLIDNEGNPGLTLDKTSGEILVINDEELNIKPKKSKNE